MLSGPKPFHFRFLIAMMLASGADCVPAADALGVPDPATIEYPEGAPPSQEEILLGKTLFFDSRLSINHRESCASCHNPSLGFSDGMAKGLGAMGSALGRNSPHLYNLAWNMVLFWDGRASSLEEQALAPIQSPGEMNMPLDSLIARLQGVAAYRERFAKVYGKSGVCKENVGRAIAAFERTLISDNSAFDKYMRGNAGAMGPEAVRGLDLFKAKGGCIQCHSGPNLTDESFHNIGLGDGDIGRAKIFPGATAMGAFKTPGLRNAALTAPYMHDGSEPTLESVVRFYNKGGAVAQGRDRLINPLHLSEGEIRDLVAFLGALTDPIRIDPPDIPKSP
jgi:cytochrome c peroxidase